MHPTFLDSVYVGVCVCVCTHTREREKERERTRSLGTGLKLPIFREREVWLRVLIDLDSNPDFSPFQLHVTLDVWDYPSQTQFSHR